MRRIAPESRIVVEQARRYEIDLVVGIGMRRGASARPAEARRPPLAVRNREAGDIVFPAQPAKAVNCGIEDGVAVGAGPLAAFRAMALAGRADLPVRSEEHTSELQSLMRISYAVFCLKKKNATTDHPHHTRQKQKH